MDQKAKIVATDRQSMNSGHEIKGPEIDFLTKIKVLISVLFRTYRTKTFRFGFGLMPRNLDEIVCLGF